MGQDKKWHLYYRLSAVMLSAFSSTFLAMPVANRISPNDAGVFLVCVGMAFWITGIGGYILLFLAYKAGHVGRGGRKRKGAFEADRAAAVLDVIFIAGVVMLTVLSKKKIHVGYGAYVILFITAMAFHMRLLIGIKRDKEREMGKGDTHHE